MFEEYVKAVQWYFNMDRKEAEHYVRNSNIIKLESILETYIRKTNN